MNGKRLIQLGVPPDHVGLAVAGLHAAAKRGRDPWNPKRFLPQLVAAPEQYLDDPDFAALAQALLEQRESPEVRREVKYARWGVNLDPQSLAQMEVACRLPVATAAALMPDAHVGYGLPIGGVLACENAVIPYAVGVDIACRMLLSVTDLPVEPLEENEASQCRELDRALERETCFGAGGAWKRPLDHDVLDEDWTITAVTREMRDRAAAQLGTSGSGNHFVEWGILELPQADLGLAAGRYVALLSHSGSRGAGAQVCRRYSDIARRKLSHRDREDPQRRHLGWLSLDDPDGHDYWQAMELMGRYAAANHELIHRRVIAAAGGQAMAVVENHHNFAWKEKHGDAEWVVHRKGATPAGPGVLGVIPGTMADPAFVVRGRGEPNSLRSASHGAGRAMSRTEAKRTFRWKSWQEYLRERKVRLLAGGLDEVPGAYKDIREVMQAQQDLVESIAIFKPRIVMMCGDDSPAED